MNISIKDKIKKRKLKKITNKDDENKDEEQDGDDDYNNKSDSNSKIEEFVIYGRLSHIRNIKIGYLQI